MRALRHHDDASRQRRAVETRAAILEAAERIFAEVGLDGARTEAIAEAAGVNKALLYYYFNSKDAIFQTVIEENMRGFRDGAMKVLLAGGSARAILLRYVSMHFDFISGRPYFPPIAQRLMMTGGKRFGRVALEYSKPLGEALGKLIGRGIRQGEFRRVDPMHTVISLTALTNHYFSIARMLQVIAGVDPYDKKQLRRRKREVLKFVRYGLFRQPEAPVL